MSAQPCACNCGQMTNPGNRYVHGHNGRSPIRDRVLSRLVIEPETGCLLWTGSLHRGGYAQIMSVGKTFYVHRLMYEWFVGPIPEGLQLDHLCRVRHCAAPDHLEAVTQRENILRGCSPMAEQSRRTHCVNGHEFTPENAYLRPDRRGRCCRACGRDRKKKAA